MRTKLILLTMVILLGVFVWGTAAFADEDYSFFYQQLAPYGQWVEVPTYGWVWSPTQVPVGWRPYSGDGHWVDSDQGPMWVPNEEWGWITYHYGRWLYGPDVDIDYGWIWIPGTVWSPGWVAWRSGNGVVGWAPLPPDRYWDPWLFNDDFAFDDIGFFWWNFVDADDFFALDLDHRIHQVSANDFDFRRTRDHTRFNLENGRVADRSFTDEQLRHMGNAREVARYTLADVRNGGKDRAGAVNGNEMGVYRPVIGDRGNPAPQVRAGNRPEGAAVNREFAAFRTMREQAAGIRSGPMLMDTRRPGNPGAGFNRFEQQVAPPRGGSGGFSGDRGGFRSAPSQGFSGDRGGDRSAPSAGRSGGGFSGGRGGGGFSGGRSGGFGGGHAGGGGMSRGIGR